VVDDEQLVRQTVTRVLAKEHDVIAVATVAEGLALCVGGARFDLILCDLMMPDNTGMDLHRELVHIAPEQANRMVFLTGGVFTEPARRFLADTPTEQVEKPFDAVALRAVVRRYVH
jgi:CheY-like chemotaxis protein